MVKRVGSWTLLLCVTVAGPAIARGWQPPDVSTRAWVVTTNNLFPGSTLTAPDRGAVLEGLVETARRLSPKVKLGVTASAEGVLYRRFDEASYGALAAGASLRREGTQLTLDGGWTPSRLKFPGDVDEGGRFSRREGTLGVRQTIGASLRARLDVSARSDDFQAPYDARDASGTGIEAQLALSASPVLSLRAGYEATDASAAAPKYSHLERVGSGGATWSPAAWRFEATLHSGVRRYADARPADSNYRRRDQWYEARARVSRTLANRLSILAGTGALWQSSSRPDRDYTLQRFELGLGWTLIHE